MASRPALAQPAHCSCPGSVPEERGCQPRHPGRAVKQACLVSAGDGAERLHLANRLQSVHEDDVRPGISKGGRPPHRLLQALCLQEQMSRRSADARTRTSSMCRALGRRLRLLQALRLQWRVGRAWHLAGLLCSVPPALQALEQRSSRLAPGRDHPSHRHLGNPLPAPPCSPPPRAPSPEPPSTRPQADGATLP